MLWFCFKLPFCLFGHTRGTTIIYEKAKCVCFFFVTALSEIHICSNNHETDLIVPHLYASYDHRIVIVWDPI